MNNLLRSIVQFQRTQDQEFSPAASPFDASFFSDKELLTLKKIVKRFKNFSSIQITNYSHLEEAWIRCEKNRSSIDYTYALSLNLD